MSKINNSQSFLSSDKNRLIKIITLAQDYVFPAKDIYIDTQRQALAIKRLPQAIPWDKVISVETL